MSNNYFQTRLDAASNHPLNYPSATNSENDDNISSPTSLTTIQSATNLSKLDGLANTRNNNKLQLSISLKEIESEIGGLVNKYTQKAGLAFLPKQRRKHVHKQGGNFSIMLAGSRGTGKTSLINSLFGTDLLPLKVDNEKKEQTINVNRFELVEDGFKLNLQVIEVSQFGNSLDNRYAWASLCNFIDEQYRSYLYQSQQPNRTLLNDTRVHVCLYFLNAAKDQLSELDVQSMKNLAKKVNLIPIVAKSDTLTHEELKNFKSIVKQTLNTENISICHMMKNLKLLEIISSNMPYSIISSTEWFRNEDNILVRGRKYDWGLVEIENPDHCDFCLLKSLLIDENMLEFTLSTEDYYESYRTSHLSEKLFYLAAKQSESILNLDGIQQLISYNKLITKEKAINESSKKAGNNNIQDEFEQRKREVKIRIGKEYTDEEKRLDSWKKDLIRKQENFRKELEKLGRYRKDLQKMLEDINGRRNASDSSYHINSEISSRSSFNENSIS